VGRMQLPRDDANRAGTWQPVVLANPSESKDADEVDDHEPYEPVRCGGKTDVERDRFP
jgi:hypothetical protein